MSYCRFIEADAYIYQDTRYGIYCCYCSLMPLITKYSSFFGHDVSYHEGFVAGYDYDKILDHIQDHRKNGDYIPEHVDQCLENERRFNSSVTFD